MRKNPITWVIFFALVALAICYGCSWIPLKISGNLPALAYSIDDSGIKEINVIIEGKMSRPLFAPPKFSGSIQVEESQNMFVVQEGDIVWEENGEVATATFPKVDEIRMKGNFEELHILGLDLGNGDKWNIYAPADVIKPE